MRNYFTTLTLCTLLLVTLTLSASAQQATAVWTTSTGAAEGTTYYVQLHNITAATLATFFASKGALHDFMPHGIISVAGMRNKDIETLWIKSSTADAVLQFTQLLKLVDQPLADTHDITATLQVVITRSPINCLIKGNGSAPLDDFTAEIRDLIFAEKASLLLLPPVPMKLGTASLPPITLPSFLQKDDMYVLNVKKEDTEPSYNLSVMHFSGNPQYGIRNDRADIVASRVRESHEHVTTDRITIIDTISLEKNDRGPFHAIVLVSITPVIDLKNPPTTPPAVRN